MHLLKININNYRYVIYYVYFLDVFNIVNFCLQIFHFNEWKYITGTALFFERKNGVKKIDPLYDNRCGTILQYVGSTRKCLEMTKKENNNIQ